jgi:uncharacterized membrane protein YgcG
MISYLESTGASVHVVETAHWRATSREVLKLLEEIKSAMVDNTEVAVVLGMTDNSFYVARTEDGSLIPHRRDIEGKYHMDGDILCSPLDSSRQVFLQLVPLLQGLPDVDKVLLAPIPRYLYNSCCLDMEHGPNVIEDDHCDKILAGISGLQKLWRGMAFRERIRNLRVVNIGPKIVDEALWGLDAVHLTAEGYAIIGNFLSSQLANMDERRRAAEDNQGAAKQGQNNLSLLGKRQASNQGDFVIRSDPRRGRGQWFPRGGSLRGGSLRGGWRSGGGGVGNGGWRGNRFQQANPEHFY